ncbi:MAG: prepilin-type N-terminal cleavage/methylation domain-containing protein [Chloroflexi bacterium]|nr:prepilin-type N-terminal cleavage/methylation domain-containing protein [Chloroflexota bacterium]
MLSQRQGVRGVTLIELMIGIAILSILMAMAVPSFRAWIQNGKVRTVAESIQNGLQIARIEAIQRNTRVQFELLDEGKGGTWTVCVQPNPAGSCPDPDDGDDSTIQSRSADEGSSTAVTVETISGDEDRPVVFAPSGRVADNPVIFEVDTDALETAESRELRIIVGASGSVRLCDPFFEADDDPRGCSD